MLAHRLIHRAVSLYCQYRHSERSGPILSSAFGPTNASAADARNLSSFPACVILFVPRPQSSPAPSSTPPPILLEPARITTTPHRVYAARSVSRPHTSTIRTRILRRRHTILRHHAASAWFAHLPSRA